MACGATLKRSIEFDPLHSPGQGTPKRRRCMPMTLSPSTPPPRSQQNSAFGEISQKLTPEVIAANLTMELRRIQKRKQLVYPCSPSPPPLLQTCSQESLSPMLGESSTQVTGHSSASHSSTDLFYNALSPTKRDIPLFTFKQVSLICERMLKDRETQIREEYDSVLTSKLAEQYEAFLKFNHDQLHRRFGDKPASYVS
ncbi:hypothetical protein ACJMK2_028005 [Sinanodonta woodiana]|uniref:Akirin 2 n=1 Tax=Sinanodonta woodiana TaxID=1069815 RepID=A0ABD3X5R3_SINWO